MPDLAAIAGPAARLAVPPRSSAAKAPPTATDFGGTATRNLVIATAVDIKGAHEGVPKGEEVGKFAVITGNAPKGMTGDKAANGDSGSVITIQGAGTAVASNKDRGTGSGTLSIGGISITGGGGGHGPRDGVTVEGQRKYQGYGLTIIGTGSSGGGLRDFGVFHDQTVYTVFIPVRDTHDETGDWTLQYALAPNSANAAHSMLVPPIAVEKHSIDPQDPRVPVHTSGMAVVQAMINVEGKFQDVRVLQTPDARLNGAICEVLNEWLFRPAEVNGQKVAVVVLLGIPFGGAR
jgi:hypothetical protein